MHKSKFSFLFVIFSLVRGKFIHYMSPILTVEWRLKMIEFKNNQYSIHIDTKNGEITSFNQYGKEFICGRLPLFEIKLRDEHGETVNINTYQAKVSEQKETIMDGRVQFSIRYSDFEKANIAVEVIVTMDEFINWKINVCNNTTVSIERISFPQVAVPNDLKGNCGTAEIAWPLLEGVLVEDIDLKENFWFAYAEPEYPNCGSETVYPAMVESQFLAYSSDKGGLYFGAHDKSDNVKFINFRKIGEGIQLVFWVYPGLYGGEDFYMDYNMVMGGFEGGWQNAAEIYRKWFESAKCGQFVEIEKNVELPDWYGESPIIITYPIRGENDTGEMIESKLFPYENVIPYIEKFAEKLNSKIMVLLMHWEGTAPWSPPYVFPPYGGEKMFNEFVNKVHSMGQILGVYCSGIGWTEQSNTDSSYNKKEQFEKEGLFDVMCLSPKGELSYSKICTPQRSGYDMCPSQDFVMETISSEVSKMINSNIDYIQILDQNHGGTSYFCYSKNHGHPPVPGRWQGEAMKHLLSELHEISSKHNKKVMFGCESAAAEPVIPYLGLNDNRYHYNFRFGKAVPIYSYVYHKYINNFMGNHCGCNAIFDFELSPESFLYQIAYSFIAGDMLLLLINEDGKIRFCWGDENKTFPNQEDTLTLVNNLNQWRVGIGKKYLHLGEMTSPYKLKGTGVNKFYIVDGREAIFEQLLTSCWRAPDGSIGQIIVNYNKQALECKVEIDDARIYENVLATPVPLEKTITLQPLTVVLIVKNVE